MPIFSFWLRLMCVAVLSVSSFSNSLAQGARVVSALSPSSTSSQPSVLLKWYSRDLYYEEGVHVYRKAKTELSWRKLTLNTVLKKKSIDPSTIKADPDLALLVQLINASERRDLQNDLTSLDIFLKSFQNNAFAEFLGIFFTDSTATEGVDYEYKINKVVNGREVLLGVSNIIKAEAYHKDMAIDSLTVFQTGKKVSFNWKFEENRYYAVNVYRTNLIDSTQEKLNKQPLVISQVQDKNGKLAYPDPMFAEDKNLKEGTAYAYQFAGCGFFGEETERTKPVYITYKDVTPPPAPVELTGKPDSMRVRLKWKNKPVPDLKGVNIYRGTKSDGAFSIINKEILSLADSAYVDSISVAGPYFYFVSAIDHAGNEAHSDLIFAEVQDVIPPAIPQYLTISADTGLLHLSWRMGREPDLAGYYLYRTVDQHDKNRYVLLNAVPLRDDHFTERLPKNVKNKFFYYIVAVDTSYNRSIASPFVSAKMPDILAPEKPFIKSVSYTSGVITINWIPNVDPDLLGYNVYRADSSKNFVKINVNRISRDAFRYNDQNHEPNVDYQYYLQAFDSAGNLSVKSNIVYARRIENYDAEVLNKLELTVKYRKRKSELLLVWRIDQQTESLSDLGFTVYAGESENSLRPISGFIRDQKLILKNSRDVAEGSTLKYYQVRGYLGSQIIYSKIIQKNI